MKNGVKDKNLKTLLTASPMLTYIGVIESVHTYPISSYGFLAEQFKKLSKPENNTYWMKRLHYEGR